MSILGAIHKSEEKKEDESQLLREENLPKNHFTSTDLQSEWEKFLRMIRTKDVVMYSAISSFNLTKKDETTIQISYPSESAKAEFDKAQGEFFNSFKRKVNNYAIQLEFKLDLALKKEVMTKRKLFEKMLEINPLLKDLDDLMKFDFT